MDFIPLLRQRKNALRDCANAQQLTPERRTKIQQNLSILDSVPWFTKGAIVLGVIFGVDWKKTVPFSKRQLPLAIGFVAVSAISDYMINNYVWKQHEAEVVRLTGFKDGIYVNPERMAAMRSKMAFKGSSTYSEDDLQIE